MTRRPSRSPTAPLVYLLARALLARAPPPGARWTPAARPRPAACRLWLDAHVARRSRSSSSSASGSACSINGLQRHRRRLLPASSAPTGSPTGKPLYGGFPRPTTSHGDTYGPARPTRAYVPFEQALPWSGSWDDLPAAHAAAIAFDLLCLGLLFLIGRRMRGPTLGLVLAYAWAANPFTLYVMDCNANDALVGGLVLGAILAASSPAGRGALIALAGMAKFAPLALAPLFATYTRGAWRFVLGGAAALVPCLLLVLGYGGLHEFYDRTLGFQASRGSPFSIWGSTGGTPRRPWSRSPASCWRWPSPSCRAGATSSG